MFDDISVTFDVNLYHLTYTMFVRFLYYTATLPPLPFHPVLDVFGRKWPFTDLVKEWGVILHLLEHKVAA